MFFTGIDPASAAGVTLRVIGPMFLMSFLVIVCVLSIRINMLAHFFSVCFDLAMDLFQKCAIMSTTVAAFTKSVFRDPHLSVGAKLKIAQAFVFSKGVFQVGTWPELSKTNERKFFSTVMRVNRRAAQCGFGHASDGGVLPSDADVLADHSLVSPLVILRRARVMFFGRIIHKAPAVMTQLFSFAPIRNSKWAKSIVSDIQWLKQWECFHGVLDDFNEFVSYVASDAKGFSRMVHRVCSTPCASVCPVQSAPVPIPGTAFPCDCCLMILPSFQQLSLHKFKAHGIRNVCRQYANITHCNICLTELFTRESCINHIRYRSKRCRDQLLRMEPLLTVAEASVLDEEEKATNLRLAHSGLRRHTAHRPSVRLSGPSPRIL